MTAFKIAILAGLLTLSTQALGNTNSPVGRWETKDDKGSDEHAIVEIYEENGKLYGKIVELVNSKKVDPVCEKCSGENKDKPIKGLVIIKDMVKDDDEWSKGKILDPKNGSEYKCTMTLEDNGNILKVRGYLGFSLLGRSQHWKRSTTP